MAVEPSAVWSLIVETSCHSTRSSRDLFEARSAHSVGLLALGFCLFAFVSAAHPDEGAPSYSLKEEGTGSHILWKTVRNISVPPDKPYSELTPEEKQRIKSLYEPMAEEDEPPYPEHGLGPIIKAVAKAQDRLMVRGRMILAVSVSSSGEATSVEVYESPDDHMTQIMGRVLLLTKYKPAVCHGVPCKMQYPFCFDFKTH